MSINEYKSAEYWQAQRNKPKAKTSDVVAVIVLTVAFPVAYTIMGILENM